MNGSWMHKQEAFKGAREKGKFCDFEIRVDQKTFSVHRVVLDYFSEYFRTMFTSDLIESKQGYCEMNGDDPEIVTQCIDFMYTGIIQLNHKNIFDLLKFSHRILLQGVVNKCEAFLVSDISLKTCVEYANVANLFQLQNLRTVSNKYINENLQSIRNLHELGETELRSLMHTVKDSPRNLCLAWNALRARISRGSDENQSPCDLIKEFPVEGLTIAAFNSSVLKDHHISICELCNEHVNSRRRIHHVKKEDVNVKNCLRYKKLAVRFEISSLIPTLDSFISKNFQSVSLNEDFIKLVKVEDLLIYLRKLQRPCSKSEFSALIKWLRETPDRISSFPQIFGGRASIKESSHFLCSIRSLTTCDSKKYSSGSNSDSDVLMIDEENCCFVKSLAEKFSCLHIVKIANKFIVTNFQSVARSPDIGHSSTKSMQLYVSTASLYESDDGKSVWTAVINWASSNTANRQSFPLVFRSMIFQKLTLNSLQEIIQSELVGNSSECLSKLLFASFVKASEIVTSQADNIVSIDKRLLGVKYSTTQLENQTENISRDFQARSSVWENKLESFKNEYDSRCAALKSQIQEVKIQQTQMTSGVQKKLIKEQLLHQVNLDGLKKRCDTVQTKLHQKYIQLEKSLNAQRLSYQVDSEELRKHCGRVEGRLNLKYSDLENLQHTQRISFQSSLNRLKKHCDTIEQENVRHFNRLEHDVVNFRRETESKLNGVFNTLRFIENDQMKNIQNLEKDLTQLKEIGLALACVFIFFLLCIMGKLAKPSDI